MQGGFDAEDDDGGGSGGDTYVNDNVEANSGSMDHIHACKVWYFAMHCWFVTSTFVLALRMVKMTNDGDECWWCRLRTHCSSGCWPCCKNCCCCSYNHCCGFYCCLLLMRITGRILSLEDKGRLATDMLHESSKVSTNPETFNSNCSHPPTARNGRRRKISFSRHGLMQLCIMIWCSCQYSERRP